MALDAVGPNKSAQFAPLRHSKWLCQITAAIDDPDDFDPINRALIRIGECLVQNEVNAFDQ
jgi:hypothetical protein